MPKNYFWWNPVAMRRDKKPAEAGTRTGQVVLADSEGTTAEMGFSMPVQRSLTAWT